MGRAGLSFFWCAELAMPRLAVTCYVFVTAHDLALVKSSVSDGPLDVQVPSSLSLGSLGLLAKPYVTMAHALHHVDGQFLCVAVGVE